MLKNNKNLNFKFLKPNLNVGHFKQTKDEKETAIFIGVFFILICIGGVYFNF